MTTKNARLPKTHGVGGQRSGGGTDQDFTIADQTDTAHRLVLDSGRDWIRYGPVGAWVTSGAADSRG